MFAQPFAQAQIKENKASHRWLCEGNPCDGTNTSDTQPRKNMTAMGKVDTSILNNDCKIQK